VLTSTSTASPGAIRNRRYRRRQREGVAVVSVEVSDGVIEKLIDGGWLAEDGGEDKHAVAAALLWMAEGKTRQNR